VAIVRLDSDREHSKLSAEQLKRVEEGVLGDTIKECNEFGPLSESSVRELIKLQVFSEGSADKLRKLGMVKRGSKVVNGSCDYCSRAFNCTIDLDDYQQNYKGQSIFYRPCIYCNKTIAVNMKRLLSADELKAMNIF